MQLVFQLLGPGCGRESRHPGQSAAPAAEPGIATYLYEFTDGDLPWSLDGLHAGARDPLPGAAPTWTEVASRWAPPT
jgi:hypothetical protein